MGEEVLPGPVEGRHPGDLLKRCAVERPVDADAAPGAPHGAGLHVDQPALGVPFECQGPGVFATQVAADGRAEGLICYNSRLEVSQR